MVKHVKSKGAQDETALAGNITVDDSLKHMILESVTQGLNSIRSGLSGSLRRDEHQDLVVHDMYDFKKGITEAQHVILLASRVLTDKERNECKIPKINKLLQFAQTTVKKAVAAKPTPEEMFFDDLDCMDRRYETKYSEVLNKLHSMVERSLAELVAKLGGLACNFPAPRSLRLDFDMLNTGGLEPIFMSRPTSWDKVAKELGLRN